MERAILFQLLVPSGYLAYPICDLLQLRLFLCVLLIVVDGRLKGLVEISCDWPNLGTCDECLMSEITSLSSVEKTVAATESCWDGDVEYSVAELFCYF
jgi:hypothetical protein